MTIDLPVCLCWRFFCYSHVTRRFRNVSPPVPVDVNRLDRLSRRNSLRKNVRLFILRMELFHSTDSPCWVGREEKRRSIQRERIDSRLVAPICFVFEDPIHLYFIFRQFYMKYFFHLHQISASSNVRSLLFSLLDLSRFPGDRRSLCFVRKSSPSNQSRSLVSLPRHSSSTVRKSQRKQRWVKEWI